MSGIDCFATPHPKQRRLGRTRVVSLTMLLNTGEGVSAWVRRAIPSAISHSRSTQRKSNPVDARTSASCQSCDRETIVLSTVAQTQRRRDHRRSLQLFGVGVGGADLDAVEVQGEGSGVVTPLNSVTGKCNATTDSYVNSSSNLIGTPGTPAGVAGQPDSVDSWRGGKRSNSGPTQQQPRGRRVLHRTVGTTLPLDPIVRRIKSWGRSGMWQEALEELKKVERLSGAAPASVVQYNCRTVAC